MRHYKYDFKWESTIFFRNKQEAQHQKPGGLIWWLHKKYSGHIGRKYKIWPISTGYWKKYQAVGTVTMPIPYEPEKPEVFEVPEYDMWPIIITIAICIFILILWMVIK